MSQQYVTGIDPYKSDEDPSAISIFKKDEEGTLVAIYHGRPNPETDMVNKITKYFMPTNQPALDEYGSPIT